MAELHGDGKRPEGLVVQHAGGKESSTEEVANPEQAIAVLKAEFRKHTAHFASGESKPIATFLKSLGMPGNGLSLPDNFPHFDFFDMIQNAEKLGLNLTIKPYGDKLAMRTSMVAGPNNEKIGRTLDSIDDLRPGVDQLVALIDTESQKSLYNRGGGRNTLLAVKTALSSIIDGTQNIDGVEMGPEGERTSIVSKVLLPAVKEGSIPSFDTVGLVVPSRRENGATSGNGQADILARTITNLLPAELGGKVQVFGKDNDILIVLKLNPNTIDAISTGQYKRKAIEAQLGSEVQKIQKKAQESRELAVDAVQKKVASQFWTSMLKNKVASEIMGSIKNADASNQYISWAVPLANAVSGSLSESLASIQTKIEGISVPATFQAEANTLKQVASQEIRDRIFRSFLDNSAIFYRDKDKVINQVVESLDYFNSQAFQLPGGKRNQKVDTYSGYEGKGSVKISELGLELLKVLNNPKDYKNVAKGEASFPSVLDKALPKGTKDALVVFIKNNTKSLRSRLFG